MRRLLIALALILTVAQHASAAVNYERLFAKVDPAVAVEAFVFGGEGGVDQDLRDLFEFQRAKAPLAIVRQRLAHRVAVAIEKPKAGVRGIV